MQSASSATRGRRNPPTPKGYSRRRDLRALEDRTAVVADPHPLWLDAVGQLVENVGLTVVASTTSAADVIALVGKDRPDILITDIFRDRDPRGALGYIHRIRKAVPGLRTIVVSSCDDVHLIDGALDHGVFAYILKTAEAEDISSAIRQAFESSVYIGRQSLSLPVSAIEEQGPHGLTKREREILSQVAEGYSNAELARMLWVTEQTVKFHLSNIYRKLNVSNRTAASRWAQANGVVIVAEPSAKLAAVD